MCELSQAAGQEVSVWDDNDVKKYPEMMIKIYIYAYDSWYFYN